MVLEYGSAICYSGYREGQNPREGIYPSHEEIHQDLLILQSQWQHLRLYDSSTHAYRVLEVIAREKLPFKVMLGADIGAEVSNPNCPWGADFDKATLAHNRVANEQQINDMIALANQYSDIVSSVSIGNEASVEWTDHLVPVERLVHYAKTVKAGTKAAVTFCENYIPWSDKLAPLAEVLDFISIHTYPVWEYQSIETAMQYTLENYLSVVAKYPNKQVVITEAGWTTASNGGGIEIWNASPELQKIYYQQLTQWSRDKQVVTFIFEAFDEPWKGSGDENEPEKHWGLYYENRQPKMVMRPNL
ncbi:glycosyl hydrolase family 17 protein [Glaciecola sp. SC05]|uniref:glycosyl hydrolase family 17 protein n=1 Tax=Glaciecola sp. SC05 TaxID=1987355 RepID=UPI003528D0E9